ncbi:replicative DNA helicase [Rosistilla oblonga]|uniref:replicative DNA helicase n=1 Tax=Rosistilla oblonga TaxID=2527990 RepID=UPI003A96D2D6
MATDLERDAAFESEKSLLGAVLVDPSRAEAISDLSGHEFLDPVLGSVFELVRDLAIAREPVADVAFLRGRLVETGLLKKLGGIGELGKLLTVTGQSQNAERYAAEVKRWHRFRFRQEFAAEFMRRAADNSDPDEELAATLEHYATALRATTGGLGAVELAHDVAVSAIDEIEARRAQPDEQSISTGLFDIDSVVGGLHPGELIILAARPSVGKSIFGAQVGIANAKRRRNVLFTSLEMPSHDIAMRMLAGKTCIDSRRLRAAKVSDAEVGSLRQAAESMRELPFALWNRRNVTVAALRGIARSMQAGGKLDLIVVDYLGLMTATDRRKPRWEQMTEISGDLKTLALELNVPVLCLCQLNREAEGQRPKLSHLRDAGAIEQDADGVWLLDRERDQAEATLNIAKNRNGVTGEVALKFDSERMQFSENSEVYEFTP